MSEIPTPPDSDAEDDLNILKVQKNARRVSDVMHHILPNLSSKLAGPLPKGMNTVDDLARDMKETVDLAWKEGEKFRRSGEKKKEEEKKGKEKETKEE